MARPGTFVPALLAAGGYVPRRACSGLARRATGRCRRWSRAIRRRSIAALDDKQPGPETQNVYTGQDAAVTHMGYNVFARNKNLWTGPGVDLTAIGAYNTGSDSYGTKFEITAISPLHCLGAAHAAAKIGEVFNFVGADNTTVPARSWGAEPGGRCRGLPAQPDVAAERDADAHPAAGLDELSAAPGVPLHMPAIFINQREPALLRRGLGDHAGPNPQVIYQPPTTLQRAGVQHDRSFRATARFPSWCWCTACRPSCRSGITAATAPVRWRRPISTRSIRPCGSCPGRSAWSRITS